MRSVLLAFIFTGSSLLRAAVPAPEALPSFFAASICCAKKARSAAATSKRPGSGARSANAQGQKREGAFTANDSKTAI